jgi:phospholipase/carboxylesterase
MNVLETKSAVVVEPGAPASAAVIWLHGLGADGHDFVPLVPELRLPPRLSVRFVFPHAPVRPVTLNGGMQMRAWYDLLGLDRSAAQDEPGINAASAIIDQLIEAQVAAGIARSHIVLAGFSQGGVMALHAGLRQREALAGILALSCYLALERQTGQALTPAGRVTPVFMCHGLHDQVLSCDMGAHSRDLLRALGVKVQWREYSMAHAVCPEEIRDISAWLCERLA